jgi:hypothetical protein
MCSAANFMGIAVASALFVFSPRSDLNAAMYDQSLVTQTFVHFSNSELRGIDRFDFSAVEAIEITHEAAAWASVSRYAESAFDTWSSRLNLRQGHEPLSDAGRQRMLTFIRAISLVESVQGTGTGNQPARDPMQSGNPNDLWWRQLSGNAGRGDRIVGGPGAPNYWAGQDFTGYINQFALQDGHDSANFTPFHSYMAGVLAYIHFTNTTAGSRSYQCADCSYERLLDGAERYNGGGDPWYRQKVDAAVKTIGTFR